MAKTGCLLNCCNFNAAVSYMFDPTFALLISLGTYFLDTPQWIFFYSWCGVQSNIAHKWSFLSFLIFSYYPFSIVSLFLREGNYWFLNTISQPLRDFYCFCFCFSLCFKLIIHWIVAFSIILCYLKNIKIIAQPAH